MDMTPEAEEKRRRRLEKKRNQPKLERDPLFLARPWTYLRSPGQLRSPAVKVMTWNLLAQCLVRSELFPTSGRARKANERIPMLHAEILSHDADILCMQEVDRLDKLLPALDLAGYAYSYASGTNKPHGCLIAYKNTIFRVAHEAMIEYDKLEVHANPEQSTQERIGSSRLTTNIANILALQCKDPESGVHGYIIATTHLFWHPEYDYERARQAGLLVRELIAFRELWKLPDWPCIIAGDFNFAPDDPAYSFLVGETLSLQQQARLQASRVVHVSIDPSVPVSVTKEVDEEDREDVIQNSRKSTLSDGLLLDNELSTLVGHRLRSAYDEAQRAYLLDGNDIATYGSRNRLSAEKAGACEPIWTSFTFHWKSTLDYIFILDAPGTRTCVTGYIQPHRAEDVERGLPQIGICGSDHFSLCVQLVTSPATWQ